MHVLRSITYTLLSFKLIAIDSLNPSNLRSTNTVARNAEIPVIKDVADDYWTRYGGCVNGELLEEGLGETVSLSADGNLLLVSSFTDVILYGYDPDGWTVVKRFGRMLVDNGRGAYRAKLARFGRFVLVGSPNNGSQGIDTGAAQAFRLNEDGVWGQLGATIIGDKAGDLLGYGVDIANLDRRIVVGAPGGNYARSYTRNGARWVYTENENLGGNIPGSDFGFSVSISADGNSAIVGAPKYVESLGMIRAYRIKTQEDTQQITGDFPGSMWGHAVAMTADGLTVAISEPGVGRVKVFRSNSLFKTWEQAGLDIIVENEEFGFSLAIIGVGTSIAVGAPGNTFNGPDAGAGYVFEYDSEWPDLNGNWIQKGLPFYAVDVGSRCGESIAFSDDGEKVVTACPSADFLTMDGGRLCVYTAPPPVAPSTSPSIEPSTTPTTMPTPSPTESPTKTPTSAPTTKPTTLAPVITEAGTTPVGLSLTQILAAIFSMILTFFGGICAGGCVGGGLWYNWCYGGYYCCDWWYEPWYYHSSYQQQ